MLVQLVLGAASFAQCPVTIINIIKLKEYTIFYNKNVSKSTRDILA